MSGLYLHGMEMPTCCETCILDHKFFKWLECKKHVTGDMIVAGRRSPSCPLVAVPDHGDLIDRDVLLKKKEDVCEMYGGGYSDSGFSRAMIEDEPVVISGEQTVYYPQVDGITTTVVMPKEENMNETNLETAKRVIKEHFEEGNCGIFNCRNWVGDPMVTVYNDAGLVIDICYEYSYFEVFGLSDEDFTELAKFYGSLEETE